LIELIVEKAKLNPAESSNKKVPEAMAETIENNMRKVIIDEQPINPKYYEKMSELLDALIEQRREEVIDYEEYLKEVKKLAENITKPDSAAVYPDAMDTRGKQSLYDNRGKDKALVTRIDMAIRHTKKAAWKDNRFKYRDVENAIREELGEYKADVNVVMELVKNQKGMFALRCLITLPMKMSA